MLKELLIERIKKINKENNDYDSIYNIDIIFEKASDEELLNFFEGVLNLKYIIAGKR